MDVLKVGDSLYYWRVKKIVENHSLVLVSELTGLQCSELVFRVKQKQHCVELSIQRKREKTSWAQGVFWFLSYSLNVTTLYLSLKKVKQVSEQGVLINTGSLIYNRLKERVKSLKFH